MKRWHMGNLWGLFGLAALLLNGWIITAAFDHVHAKEAAPVLPGTERCPAEHRLVRLSGHSRWRASEVWAWDQICIGESANFKNWLEKSTECPPQDTDDAKAPIISSNFVKTILAYKPFVDLIPQDGIVIECAFFQEKLVLTEIRSPHRLLLEYSTFTGGVEAINFHTAGELSFYGSHFSKCLILDRSRIGGTLFLDHAKFDAPQKSNRCEATPYAIQALFAEVGNNLRLTRVTSNGHINAGGISINGDLNLRNGFYKMIFLNGADVAGDINTCVDLDSCSDDSRFKHLSLDGASVRGSVALNGSVFTGGGPGIEKNVSLDLTAANIRKHLELQNIELSEDIKGDGVHVGGNAFLRGKKNKFQAVSLVGARFGGSLDLRGSTFAGLLDLSNLQVQNTLILHACDDSYPALSWNDAAGLSLQNAKVESLQDWGCEDEGFIYKHLSDKLNLSNFSYRQFGLIGPSGASRNSTKGDGRMTGKERVTHWLALQRGYTERALPQPFEQLAMTLERTGYVDEARDVRIASRDQRLHAVETPVAEKALLLAQRLIIYYGYNSWLSLAWLALFVLLGGFVGKYGKDLSTHSFCSRFWYSLNAAIPLLELDEQHKQVDLTGVRGYFYIHRIVGFVLVSFLIAGLSGLTK